MTKTELILTVKKKCFILLLSSCSTFVLGQTVTKLTHLEFYVNNALNGEVNAPKGYQLIIDTAAATITVKSPPKEDMVCNIRAIKTENGIHVYECLYTTPFGSEPVLFYNDPNKKWFKFCFAEDSEVKTGNYTLLFY